MATSNSFKSVKIRVGSTFIKCVSTLLLRGLVVNPNEDNVININQQDQSGAAEVCVGPNPQVLESSKILSIGLEHLKVKATSPQVEPTDSKWK